MSNANIDALIDELLNPKLNYRSIPKDYSQSQTVNAKICSECGGECCKQCGCHFSPDDFKEISFNFLKQEMEKGFISIDYVDGEAIYQSFGVYILRVRNRNAPIVDLGLMRSPCILLTQNGCKLDYQHRPTGGKLLIPSTETYPMLGLLNRRCYSKYSIKLCCYEWQPHQKVLHNLLNYFMDKEIPCSL